ncbi:glycosyl hydrolase family 17 protein [Ideonella sp.]|jgi:exo-beta-1,3-glucanase (GH17 family)|uniref:glycosyl hydrolase family 17 protein n=1 Tax=Ideonella sp. TaxID=1929293 RepID=UPI0037C19F60
MSTPSLFFTGLLGRTRALAAGLIALLMTALLVACGGGGQVPAQTVQARSLSPEFFSRKAVNYSPYRTSNRDTEVVTKANIQQDLELLAQGGFTLIRIFDSSDAVAKATLQVIKERKLDMKMMLGIYVASGNEAFSQAEMARGVALANAYPDIVLAVSVGNETMVSWSFNKIAPETMAGYISTVRNQITQPVTTDDNWAFWASAPKIITDVVDFAAVHTYPLLDTIFSPDLWDWQQSSVPAASRAAAMMDAAIASAKKEYSAVRTYLDGRALTNMPIVIGETGWKAIPAGGETSRAHPVNQKMYFDRLTAWKAEASGPKNIFYFEAFDEPWKQGDDKWGLFNVNRQARYVVQSLYPQSLWEPGNYTAADALYYIPPINSGPVTANRYTLYSEVATAGEAKPAEIGVFNAWENGSTAAYPEVSTSAAPGDGSKSIEITPIPQVWGWGLALGLPTTAENLSNFATAGRLNFSIKTTYAGKLEVGFLTGTTGGGSAYDVYLPISSGEYGYMNDGQWHEVSIPLSAITPRGAMAFGMTDPAKSKLDLTKVTNPFVIADRYSVTGNGAGATTKIYIDKIYWSK